MRRHFTLQRLALVVAWAALAPKCALLVQNWTGLLPQATVSDAVRVAAEFQGKWNRWSDRAGTVAEKITTQFLGSNHSPVDTSSVEPNVAEPNVAEANVAEPKVPKTMAHEETTHEENVTQPNLPKTLEPSPAERAVVQAGFPSAADVAARRMMNGLSIDSQVPNLPGVVIR